MKNYLNKSSDGEIDLYIYGDVTSNDWKYNDSDVSSYDIKELLENFKDVKVINVHINSCGGDVYEGIAIYNLLKNHNAKVKVYIDGIAASIASAVAMAGDEIIMSESSMMMIHNCYCWAQGNSQELRKQADDMDKVMQAVISCYMSKINITEEKLKEMLAEETYLSAEECLKIGFATSIVKLKKEEVTDVLYASMFYTKLIDKIKQKDNLIKEKDKELNELRNNGKKEDLSINKNLLELFLNNIK